MMLFIKLIVEIIMKFLIGFIISEKSCLTDSVNHNFAKSELIHITIYL